MKIKIHRLCLCIAAVTAGMIAENNADAQAGGGNKATPNIIIILADDMGFSDLGCYGSEIPTPNIDKLANNGIRFSQCYNGARCCPSRASLLTGLYPHRAGVGGMSEAGFDAEGKLLHGYEGRLTDDTVTIPEALRNAGYFTAMVGKWHLGQEYGVTPWGRGFMRSLTSPGGGYYYPEDDRAKLFLDGESVGHGGKAGVPAQWYATDLFTDYGLKFIDDARTQKKPFFLYLAYTAPHFPLEAPAEEIARFRGHYIDGWDRLREERYRREVQLGAIDGRWRLSPRPGDIAAWDSLSAAEKDRYDHIMAIFAAVVSHLDSAIGRLVDGLRQRGQLDNTLIMFLSDNGGSAEAFDPVSGNWENTGPHGDLEGAPPGGPRSQVFVGESWALLENTPFRRYKSFDHEGGIAAPFIVHWPSGIPSALNGKWISTPVHIIDALPTCLDVAGATCPQVRAGHSLPPPAGISLAPAFRGEPLRRRSPLFWEHEGNAAVRDGDWKLVRLGPSGPWELYNLNQDRTEIRDMATTDPKKAAALAQKWLSWAQNEYVLPKPVRYQESPND
jgi:arylsulfatase